MAAFYARFNDVTTPDVQFVRTYRQRRFRFRFFFVLVPNRYPIKSNQIYLPAQVQDTVHDVKPIITQT